MVPVIPATAAENKATRTNVATGWMVFDIDRSVDDADNRKTVRAPVIPYKIIDFCMNACGKRMKSGRP
jgi:hypothetical protein